MLMGVVITSSITFAASVSKEYQVKAAFLLNFTDFVTWSEDVQKGDKSSLVIGVLGKNPFGSYLDEITKTAKRKNIENHTLN